MTLKQFYELVEDMDQVHPYIVRLKYKYDVEDVYTYSNELYLWDWEFNSYVWYMDWNEGQTDVTVIGFIALDELDDRAFEGGRWISLYNPLKDNSRVYCLKCGYKAEQRDEFPLVTSAKFCPSCGSYMKGVVEYGI